LLIYFIFYRIINLTEVISSNLVVLSLMLKTTEPDTMIRVIKKKRSFMRLQRMKKKKRKRMLIALVLKMQVDLKEEI
jgi:hypothetical protein